jgi:hypothetical protein
MLTKNPSERVDANQILDYLKNNFDKTRNYAQIDRNLTRSLSEPKIEQYVLFISNPTQIYFKVMIFEI